MQRQPFALPAGSPLPDDFAFSQSSLQAYTDCPRRFWLTYVERLPWPAAEASPVQDHERLMRLGDQYHRLVQRAELGLDLDELAQELPAPLDGWFDAYRAYRPADLAGARVEVECNLSIHLEIEQTAHATPVRLAAKYDLIAATQDGRFIIVDWKTGHRRADPVHLQRRLQSVVYPFVLVEAAPYLGWGPIAPEQVEMRYWFTAAPTQPAVFPYGSFQHAANRQRIAGLVAAILAGHSRDDFPLAPDSEATRRRLCRFCTYRSRCNRGIEAGDLNDLSDLDNTGDVEDLIPETAARSLDFGMDEIAELSF
ncbi:MAG: hypothetical protein DCC57_08130 [Chloroflexi bacterium]|nr:MAG: hypothetical protein DCC57_08130 [Chloroflexota bacterium]